MVEPIASQREWPITTTSSLPNVAAANSMLPTRDGATMFPTGRVRRTSSMQFNVADYGHLLMADFLAAGGHVEHREFHSLAELATLEEKVVINCPGYGARALCKDESVVPVRGQIAWLIPQEGAHYGLIYKDLNVVARRDGIVVQPIPGGDDFGFNDDNEQPDRQAAEAGVLQLKELFDGMAAMRRG